MPHPTTRPRRGRQFRRAGLLMAAALSAAAFAAPGAAHAANCPGADSPVDQSDPVALAQAGDTLACVANEFRDNAGLPLLTPDQQLMNFAHDKAVAIAQGADNVACGGLEPAGFKFSVCIESVEVLVPAPTPRQLIDGILKGDGNALMNHDVTTIGAGAASGNPTDGPGGAGVTADVLTTLPTDAGGNTGGTTTPPANDGQCADAATPITQDNIGAAEDALTCLVNAERAKVGRGPVQADARLDDSATAHSQDMVDNGFFGHTNLDGASFCDRIQNAGYPVTCEGTGDDTLCTYCLENIAYRGGGVTPNDFMYDPEDGWMTHAPDQMGPDGQLHNYHKEAILDPNIKAIGVGVVVGTPDGDADGATATQDFGG